MSLRTSSSNMRDFYQGFGLNDYPFNLYTAENENEFGNKLFIQPQNYDTIKSSFDGNRSIIIRGNRGTGKTALIIDLQHSAYSDASLMCLIDDYSELSLHPSITEYYNLLLTNISSALFLKLFDEKERLKKINKEDRLLLSFLLKQYTPQVTQSELTRKIETIQMSGLKRFIKKNINLIRYIVNYGFTAGLNLVNDVIRNYIGLPPVDESQIREIVPKLSLEAETDFKVTLSTYRLLLNTCAVIKRLGYERTIVFFDKFDEDYRMENNAEIISDFFKALLTDNKLLETSDIQIVVSVWEVPFSKILSEVRTQKHFCPKLSWSVPKLKDALNRRLAVFSENKITNYEVLLSEDIPSNMINDIFYLSNGNPRDLWHIFDHIFQAQFSLNSTSRILTEKAVANGLMDFVSSFNFYEYYPKKLKSKSSTMDVYAYIKHLLKLKSDKFTKNQLNDQAKTGSSTNNYVVGMENMGLVIKTNEKLNGGVVYAINDPKVVYAMKNGIDISKK